MLGTLRKNIARIELRELLTLMLILGTLAISAYIGWRSGARLPKLTGLGTVLVLGAYVLLRWPASGLVLLIPVSFFLLWELGTGTKVPINATVFMTIGLLGLWFLRMLVYERKIRLAPSPVNLPVLSMIGAGTLSLLVGNIGLVLIAEHGASLPAQLGGWMLLVLPLGLFLLAGNTIPNLRWLKLLTWLFIILGSIFIFVIFVPIVSQFIFILASITTLFRTWLAALALGQALWNQDLPRPVRGILCLISITVCYESWLHNKEWVAGWAPPLVAIAVLVWLRNWRWGLALTLASLGFYFLRSTVLVAQVWTNTQQYSTLSRQATWPIMLELIKANPIFGLGPANYYHYTPLFPILGFYVQFNSHNNYVDIVAQYGLLGLGLFGWLVFAISQLGWKLRKEVRDGFSQGYVNAALAGLIATLVSGFMADWFLPFLYNIGIPGYRSALFAWLFLGGLLALDNIRRQQKV